MEIKLDMPFEQLRQMVHQLSKNEKEILKAELELNADTKMSGDEFRKFLLKGPVFSRKQIQAIKDARKQINTWRTT